MMVIDGSGLGHCRTVWHYQYDGGGEDHGVGQQYSYDLMMMAVLVMIR